MESRNHTLLGLSQFVHRYFLWVLIGAYAVAAVLPAPRPRNATTNNARLTP